MAGDGLYDALCWFWCPEDGVHERSQRDGVPYEDWVRDGFLIATPGNVTDYAFVKALILEQATKFRSARSGMTAGTPRSSRSSSCRTVPR